MLEQDVVRVEVEMFGETTEEIFKSGLEIRKALFEGEQEAHEDFAGSGTVI